MPLKVKILKKFEKIKPKILTVYYGISKVDASCSFLVGAILF